MSSPRSPVVVFLEEGGSGQSDLLRYLYGTVPAAAPEAGRGLLGRGVHKRRSEGQPDPVERGRDERDDCDVFCCRNSG